jgi:L-malate glycosyltransferase
LTSKITLLNPAIANQRGKAYGAVPRILLVLDQFPRTLGGGERIVLKLASLLPSYGYDVAILTFGVHPETIRVHSPACPVYLLPLQRTYDLHALQAAMDLRRFLKKQRIQIVHTFFESSDIWAGFVSKTVSNTHLIWSRRDMGILRKGKHHLAYRLMASLPDAVFAVSEEVRRHCIEVDGIDPDRVQTIHNGLNLDDWTPSTHAPTRNHTVITTVGNIRRVKGHDLFIRAAAQILPSFPNVSFSIAGAVLEPEYFAELQDLVRDLNLTGRFHFVGGISDLHTHLAAADIFVLPSRSEGFSNAIVEAMATSLPVVATDVGGNAEAVEDGVTGFIIPPENPQALATAISRLLGSPALATRMGVAGRQRALDLFTTEAMMHRITDTYAHLLN